MKPTSFAIIAALAAIVAASAAQGASILLGGFDGTQTQNTIAPATTISNTGVRELKEGFVQDAAAVGNVAARIWTDQTTGKELQWGGRVNSTNTLWGLSAFDAAPASGTNNPYVATFRIGGSTSHINYEITNTGTQDVTLDTLHFNLLRGTATDEGGVTVSLVQNGTFADPPVLSASPLTSVSPVTVSVSGSTAWVGFEVDLSSVSSTTLAAGQTATYRIATGNWTSDNFMDNIAISGEFAAIPEPSAALLGGLGILALLRRRR